MERILKIIESLDFENRNNESFTFEQIANAFKQGRVELPLLRKIGGGGNCASIALIKAAIGSFGFSGIFRSINVDTQKNRFLINLIDEEEKIYKLSFINFKLAKSKSAFELNNEDDTSKNILEFSNFCYAVMAEIKRRTYRRRRRYKRAITDLNKGESTRYIYELLGLEKEKIEDVSIENLGSLNHLVVWNPPHAVYSSEGFYDEFFSGHNDIEPLGKLKDIHGGGTTKDDPKGAYKLKE
ncbi:hypothetical protein [Flavivirga jejuensis]|uniref:Uncharacterized protein n=1 Tax=Flavivirga jejuensis TaxID=870487 RepID=A0ABT8WUQ9_9FLAO|nr:hypothetical protein [Flavivirga jejuensis]MDO5976912.1 hypothetical protein [Flavivirga jejuensis]